MQMKGNPDRPCSGNRHSQPARAAGEYTTTETRGGPALRLVPAQDLTRSRCEFFASVARFPCTTLRPNAQSPEIQACFLHSPSMHSLLLTHDRGAPTLLHAQPSPSKQNIGWGCARARGAGRKHASRQDQRERAPVGAGSLTHSLFPEEKSRAEMR